VFGLFLKGAGWGPGYNLMLVDPLDNNLFKKEVLFDQRHSTWYLPGKGKPPHLFFACKPNIAIISLTFK
jgi:hypothetical protein